jgi:hypothetical protein
MIMNRYSMLTDIVDDRVGGRLERLELGEIRFGDLCREALHMRCPTMSKEHDLRCRANLHDGTVTMSDLSS